MTPISHTELSETGPFGLFSLSLLYIPVAKVSNDSSVTGGNSFAPFEARSEGCKSAGAANSCSRELVERSNVKIGSVLSHDNTVPKL